jgi:hypothetical protein
MGNSNKNLGKPNNTSVKFKLKFGKPKNKIGEIQTIKKKTAFFVFV